MMIHHGWCLHAPASSCTCPITFALPYICAHRALASEAAEAAEAAESAEAADTAEAAEAAAQQKQNQKK